MVFDPVRFSEDNMESIKNKQFSLLKEHLHYCYNNSPYYRKLFQAQGISPYDIKNFEDFSCIPVTTKQNLREHNEDFFAAPEEDWVDMLTTSGTTGEPIYMPATRSDLKRLSITGAQTLSLSGIGTKDIVHLAMPMSAWMWMAGYGFYLCFSTLGVMVLRFGPGYTEKSLTTMKNLKATALMAVPSYAMKMGEEAEKLGLRLNVKRIFTVGENILEKDLSHNALGKKLEDLWQAKIYSCYGGTEGPILNAECGRGSGHHINPYEAYIEILDPHRGKPVPKGQEGVVVVTPLMVQGFPLIRYQNGDVSFLNPDRCSCGEMLDNIGPILGRTDQMLKIKGVLFYPNTIIGLISQFKTIGRFQVEAFTENMQDMIRIYIPDDTGEPVKNELETSLRNALGVKLEIRKTPLEELARRIMPPERRKPQVFIDNRCK